MWHEIQVVTFGMLLGVWLVFAVLSYLDWRHTKDWYNRFDIWEKREKEASIKKGIQDVKDGKVERVEDVDKFLEEL